MRGVDELCTRVGEAQGASKRPGQGTRVVNPTAEAGCSGRQGWQIDAAFSSRREDMRLGRGIILYVVKDTGGRLAMRRPDLELVRGAIDMHAHTSPCLFERPLDDTDLAKLAIDYGMRGFVLKDHDSPTTGRAYGIAKAYPEVQAFGAIVLNRTVGSFNPYVVQAAIQYGAKIVWMPTYHSKWHTDFFKMSDYPDMPRMGSQLAGGSLNILEPTGAQRDEILLILDLVAEANVCLATGHLSLPEIRFLLDQATGRGVRKFIVTHANWSLCKLDLDVQKELVQKGATLEYVAATCVSPVLHEQDLRELAYWISEFKGEHLVLGSDLGHMAGPPHPEGLRMLLAGLLGEGVPYEYLEKMTKANTAAALGIE